MTKLKIIYRKNLRMSEGKVAAQAVHAAIGLGANVYSMRVVVLGVSDKKFWDITTTMECFIVHDAGHTEVAPDTPTCAAFFADE